MNIAVFLSLGETWEELEQKGQAQLLLQENFNYYSKNFKKVYIFSYGKKSAQLKSNVFLIGNRWGIHRFAYWLLLPILNFKILNKVNILRGMQLTGALPGLVTKLITGKKIVINYGYNYSQFARIEKKYFRAYLLRYLTPLLIYLVDSVIVTTPFLLSGRNQSKIHLIPNGINTLRFKPKKIKKTISVLFVGRFETQKNLPLLIEAVGRIKKPLSLVFIGSGSLKSSLIKLAKSKNVKLQIIPPQPHDLLATYYQKTHIFILPSLIEGHPKVLLEAMSCETAVIGTNVIGIREIIQHRKNGLLVESKSQSLTTSINQLLNNSRLRSALGKAARKTIITKFDSHETWKKEISLLKNLTK